MAKNEDVVKGLDPDLFEASLTDDEPDNVEPASKEPSEEEVPEGDEPSTSEEVSEEELQEEASSGEEEAAAPAKSEEAPAPPSKEGDPSDVASSYEVQRGFTAAGGKTYHPGDVIPIKCKHCALWEREWLGKKRCSAGRRLDADTVMSAERFSCGSFFVCKEYDAELSTFLSMSLPEILTVRSMLPGLKKILGASDFLGGWLERHAVEADLREVFANAKGFVMSFNNLEQLNLAEGFIRQYSKVASQKARPKRPPKPKFESGDWVEWKDLVSKERVEGLILSIARGNIILAGVKSHKGQKFTYKYKEWKNTRDPQITKKTASPE